MPRWLLFALMAALAFYAVNAVHYGNQPLRIEERVWPPMAEATYRSGEPVIEADETRRVRFLPDLSVDKSPFLAAHPPLYIYTLASTLPVLGTDSPQSLRAVGILGLLASTVLLFLIARETTRRWRLVGGMAAILLLLHPYAIQGSLFLDIDTTIYPPIALMVLWLAIRYGKQQAPLRPRQVIAVGAALALLTWAKMPPTIVLTGVLAVWWLLSRRPTRRAALEVGWVVAVGAALFFSTYGLWCLITGVPFSYTFDVTFAQKTNRLFSEWWLVENAMHWHLRWFGAALIVLGVAYLVDLIRHFLAQRRLRPLDLLFLVSCGILVQYVLISPTDGTYQGKYAFPGLVTMSLPVTWLLLRGEPGRRPAHLWAAALAIAGLAALLLPDMLTGLSFSGDYGTWGFELWTTGIAAAALLATLLLGRKGGFPGGVLLALVVLMAAQSVRSYEANTAPMYPIADTDDFTAAIADLNHDTEPNDIVVVPKDAGFYVKRHIIEGEDAFARGDGLLADVIRAYPRVTAFASDSFGPPIGPRTQEVLASCFRDKRVYGTAWVAHRTNNCG